PYRLEADIKGGPACRELALPGKLPLSVCHPCRPLVSASFLEAVSELRSLASIGDGGTHRIVRVGVRRVDPPAVLADRGVWQDLLVLGLTDHLLDLLPDQLRVLEYRLNLFVEEALFVRLGPADEGVVDSEHVERFPQECASVLSVRRVTTEGIGNLRDRVGEIFLQPLGITGRNPPQAVEVIREGEQLRSVPRALEGHLHPVASDGVSDVPYVWGSRC